MPRVALDVQHLYRAHKPLDRGSSATLAGGLVVWESDLSRDYAEAIARELRARGVAVLTNDPTRGQLVGYYSERGRQAVAWGADVYLACHVNAGRGQYALAEVLEQQPAALELAGQLVEAVRLATAFPYAVPPITSATVRTLRRGDRGHVCLAGVDPSSSTLAVLLEPFFIDSPRHACLTEREGLERIGYAIAAELAGRLTGRRTAP